MATQRRWSNRWDILCVLVFVLAALLFFFLFSGDSSPASCAEVYRDGQLIGRIDLNTDGAVTLPACPEAVFEVRGGAVRFQSADCPDHTCVRTGFLSSPGQCAVCLPNAIVLTVTGGDAPDIIVR